MVITAQSSDFTSTRHSSGGRANAESWGSARCAGMHSQSPSRAHPCAPGLPMASTAGHTRSIGSTSPDGHHPDNLATCHLSPSQAQRQDRILPITAIAWLCLIHSPDPAVQHARRRRRSTYPTRYGAARHARLARLVQSRAVQPQRVHIYVRARGALLRGQSTASFAF
jgi:hypothetical protein